LKSKRVAIDIADQFRELLNRQPTLIPNKGLVNWLNFQHKNKWRNTHCSSSYSIDYNDESIISYLALCHGDILGKKYQLKKREE
jgi:hypothetical protein